MKEEIKNKIKVELLKYPTEEEWLWVKQCTLNTVGKKLKSKSSNVDEEWKIKLLKSEHSPIRELWFGFRLNIPYWVSNHLVRHHDGISHYVQTERTDRTGIDRDELSQANFVSPSTVTLQAPHMPVPSTIIGFILASV